MSQIGLHRECDDLERIIEDLAMGKETCEIEDSRYTFEDVLNYLRGYLQELKDLDARLLKQGNTPELLKEVHDKYSELWLFQVSFTVDSLPRVIGRLWRYPDLSE